MTTETLKIIENNKKIEKNNKYSKYTTNNYIMTQTELLFYKQLKEITDKLELIIFSQIDLERLIKVKDNNMSDRNKIKSRSVDFCIVNSKNCKVICCIELDDKSHNTYKAKIIDNFKNELFESVSIPLHRIKVSNFYNLKQIEQLIKGDL